MWTGAFVWLLCAASAKAGIHHPSQHVFTAQDIHNEELKIPTERETVAMARKIMHLTTIGNLVTTFPESQSSDLKTSERRPPEIGGSPIGLMEYYADCDPLSGDPILLMVNVATPYKNYHAGSNISLSIRWWPKRKNTFSLFGQDDDDEIPTPHTPAALPRFSLHGRLEPVSEEKFSQIQACFLHAHPDSYIWQPGNDIHESHYVQLVVDHVYWFGGFGDRARIQWLPMEQWRNLTMDEIIQAELPGESRPRSWWWN